MKYALILCLIAFLSCSTKMMNNTKEMNILDAIKNGKDIVIKDQIIDDELDFTKLAQLVRQNNASQQAIVTSNLYFEGCTFTSPITGYVKNKDFNEISSQFLGAVAFINCKFKNKVDLKYSTFYQSVDFSDCTFVERANFQDVTFIQRANYRGVFCQEEAHFQNARFFHKSNFMETKFNGHLMFQSVNFRDETNFSLSECLKYVDFSLVKFDGTASFNYLNWTDRAVFNDAVWIMDANFIQPKFGDISFKNSETRGKFLMSKEVISGEYVKK